MVNFLIHKTPFLRLFKNAEASDKKNRISHPQNRSKFCSLLPSTNNLLQNLIKTKLQKLQAPSSFSKKNISFPFKQSHLMWCFFLLPKKKNQPTNRVAELECEAQQIQLFRHVEAVRVGHGRRHDDVAAMLFCRCVDIVTSTRAGFIVGGVTST